MIFKKDDAVLEVTDPVHIDCLRAKGWKEELDEEPKEPSAEQGKEKKEK